MPKTVYYNGKFYKKGAPVLSIYDRSIFFGDAVYDAIIGRDGGLFLHEEHLARLYDNAKRLDIPLPCSSDAVLGILYKVIKKSELSEYFLYVQLSRCTDERVHSYPESAFSSLLVTVSPFSLKPMSTGLKLMSAEDKRYGFCNIKTVNLLPAVLASKSAEKNGCDEAVFVRDGFVTECAHSNISILKDGCLITHHDCERILPGIAKKHLLSACRTLGVEVIERPFSFDELRACDEALVTSTTKLCLPAAELDGKKIGGKSPELLLKIQNYLFSEYANWTM